MQRMDPAFTLLLEQYRKNGDELLNHVIWLTGDGSWVLFVNVEFKE
jgi:hypothetical protein